MPLRDLPRINRTKPMRGNSVHLVADFLFPRLVKDVNLRREFRRDHPEAQ